ncbi:MAG: hypothetical protein M1335_08085 [Chloroflexi bacterium]|nr:hypothetical protein [Chloroflexota bacterium]
MKAGPASELYIPDWGPSDIRQVLVGYSDTQNPGYLAFRNPKTGMVVGAVATGIQQCTMLGKYSGAWDRNISFGNASECLGAKIYWYSDMSNGYEGIERFSKQVLNPLRVEVSGDVEPPDTQARTTPPSPDGPNGFFSTPVKISLDAGEAAETYYRWDGGVWFTYEGPISGSEGSHALEYYSIDSSGNVEQPKTLTTDVDLSPPAAFNLISPLDGSIGRLVNVPFSWEASTDTGSGLAGYDLYFDGTVNASTDGTSTTLVGEAPDGAHSWFVRAKDKAGRFTDSVTRRFYLDTQPPSTTSTLNPDKPEASGWFNGEVSVSLTATDSVSGVASTLYSLDNGATWRPYEKSFAIGHEGVTSLLYKSVDRVGNVEEPRSRAIRIDTTPPEARIHFDPSTKDLGVSALDASGAPVAISCAEKAIHGCLLDRIMGYRWSALLGRIIGYRWSERVYTLTDRAGNTLELTVEINRGCSEINARLEGLKYNGASMACLVGNKLKFEWCSSRAGDIKNLVQKITVGRDSGVQAKYSSRGDTSLLWDGGACGRPTRESGLIILKLATGNGHLKILY